MALSPEQDDILDGPESFNLVATNTGGTSASGVGTIVDDGTGSYFAADNNMATPAVPAGVALDDDNQKPPPLIGKFVEAAPANQSNLILWHLLMVNSYSHNLTCLKDNGLVKRTTRIDRIKDFTVAIGNLD